MVLTNQVRVALIDMNNGHANQGMRGIQEIIHLYRSNNNIDLIYSTFNIREKGEVPGLDFDIYISSGGPGSPYDGEGSQWENDFFDLLENIEAHNRVNEHKKHVFLICHSFQLACRKYGLGTVAKRKSTAFGIFPVHLTADGQADQLFVGLNDTFYAVDSRDWQVISPDNEAFRKKNAKILAIEKERPHVDLERCIMSIRFSNEIVGTQFHPEADPVGMEMYLLTDEKKKIIVENHGQAKYDDMLSSLGDPNRIMLTQRVILPNFLNEAIGTLAEA